MTIRPLGDYVLLRRMTYEEPHGCGIRLVSDPPPRPHGRVVAVGARVAVMPDAPRAGDSVVFDERLAIAVDRYIDSGMLVPRGAVLAVLPDRDRGAPRIAAPGDWQEEAELLRTRSRQQLGRF